MNPDALLSELLQKGDLGFAAAITATAIALVLGAVHALSPGHGKALVAAYLVGAKGTMRHAILLGGIVTFTHTASVFLMGFAALFLSHYILPDKIVPVLSLISGLTIVWLGARLLHRRLKKLRSHHHHHHHKHSHLPEGDVTWSGLIALGASGGLVPCPSALVLLLSSIALGRAGLGLLLLTAFSAGLAMVLMGIGMLVLYAKSWIPESSKAAAHPALRYMPVVSAAVILGVGLVMTGMSLGMLRV